MVTGVPVVPEGPASRLKKHPDVLTARNKRQSVSKDTDWSDSFVVAEEASCENLSPVVMEVSAASPLSPDGVSAACLGTEQWP